jgi:hypothetical protein
MADLTITISEKISLRGFNVNESYTQTIQDIQNIDCRLMNVPSQSLTTIYQLGSTVGAGTFLTSSFAYGRISNTSTSAPVRLVVSSSQVVSEFLIATGSSFILSTSKVSGSGQQSSDYIFTDITAVLAQAQTGSANIEYFIATK